MVSVRNGKRCILLVYIEFWFIISECYLIENIEIIIIYFFYDLVEL